MCLCGPDLPETQRRSSFIFFPSGIATVSPNVSLLVLTILPVLVLVLVLVVLVLLLVLFIVILLVLVLPPPPGSPPLPPMY